ncbi:MAG: hypothetical protein OXF06_11970, partial [Bacteroidetes bacterium]|nr:hypothetical protein [Bacteroidota bacterium]
MQIQKKLVPLPLIHALEVAVHPTVREFSTLYAKARRVDIIVRRSMSSLSQRVAYSMHSNLWRSTSNLHTLCFVRFLIRSLIEPCMLLTEWYLFTVGLLQLVQK